MSERPRTATGEGKTYRASGETPREGVQAVSRMEAARVEQPAPCVDLVGRRCPVGKHKLGAAWPCAEERCGRCRVVGAQAPPVRLPQAEVPPRCVRLFARD